MNDHSQDEVKLQNETSSRRSGNDTDYFNSSSQSNPDKSAVPYKA